MNIEHLENALEEHGELHIVIEEHDSVAGDEFIGIRSGNTEFDHGLDLIKVDDGDTVHVFRADRVVYYHKPNSFPD